MEWTNLGLGRSPVECEVGGWSESVETDLFANKGDLGIVYSVSGNNVQDAGVLF
jgi:hypothetical protein